jgi:hypothetical protein
MTPTDASASLNVHVLQSTSAFAMNSCGSILVSTGPALRDLAGRWH